MAFPSHQAVMGLLSFPVAGRWKHPLRLQLRRTCTRHTKLRSTLYCKYCQAVYFSYTREKASGMRTIWLVWHLHVWSYFPKLLYGKRPWLPSTQRMRQSLTWLRGEYDMTVHDPAFIKTKDTCVGKFATAKHIKVKLKQEAAYYYMMLIKQEHKSLFVI